MTTWIEQRVDALEARLADLSKQVRGLAATELMLAGAGSPDGIVNAVQGTHYWDITNQVEYVNISIAGTPPEGTLWTRFFTADSPQCVYQDCWYLTQIDNVAQTLLAAGNVAAGITLLYIVSAVAGGDAVGGTVTLEPGDSFDLYDDGTDSLQITCTAGGAVTLVRDAGADSFNANLYGVWL